MNELDLFAAAIAIDDPTKRAELLDRECAGRSELRQRLERLLAAHAQSHALLDSPDPGAPYVTAALEPAPSRVGTIVAGRYKLLEEVGEGGMGTVWMAEQREPVKRLVALKLIKPGMDSRSVLARFEAERQALALMDHPNIAKVLDGGTTAEGRPYFVMELVKGLPLTEYCDARRLSVRDRLELFAQVCSAVQHAHQKGVIHRDLKPTNVLVTEHEYGHLDRDAEAAKLFEEVLAAQKRMLGPDHPETLQRMLQLAQSYSALDRTAEALKLGEETLAACKRVLPPGDPQTLGIMYTVAINYAKLNRHADALPLAEEDSAHANRPEFDQRMFPGAIMMRMKNYREVGLPTGRG